MLFSLLLCPHVIYSLVGLSKMRWMAFSRTVSAGRGQRGHLRGRFITASFVPIKLFLGLPPPSHVCGPWIYFVNFFLFHLFFLFLLFFLFFIFMFYFLFFLVLAMLCILVVVFSRPARNLAKPVCRVEGGGGRNKIKSAISPVLALNLYRTLGSAFLPSPRPFASNWVCTLCSNNISGSR